MTDAPLAAPRAAAAAATPAPAASANGLILRPNIEDPDGFYAELLAAHEGLDEAQSQALNARLLLVLANHVGDRAVLSAALQAAAEAG